MTKLTKRVIEGLQSDGSKHGTLFWDSELKGFGVRVFQSGVKTFVVKFRTRGGFRSATGGSPGKFKSCPRN